MRIAVEAGCATARHLLRSEGQWSVGRARIRWRELGLLVALPSAAYGFVMGLSSGRLEQALYSAAKVPLLLVLSSLAALPSSYVLHAALGLREDFAATVRGVGAAQGTMALALASLAPLVALAYVSHAGYEYSTGVNGAAFLAATCMGHITLVRHVRPLLERSRAHRVTLGAWFCVHTFVAIQLAWILRPFIGDPAVPPTFFRDHAFENAYVEVWRKLGQVVGASSAR